MKHSLAIATVALALTLGASAAFAFSTVTSGNDNIDNKASTRLADPDDLMDNMANQQSGAGSGSATIMRFGSGSLQFQGGTSGNPSVGVENNFIQSPGANLVPSQRR